ncbi:paired amphipathic helix protein Sin3-like 5 [Curcuma longa]|uniref:paired amphipathic helix protein Sin3-like 5 n=1 Tax=Curcuma longa TaxID=136217 RepID=UPI003D9EE845
MKDFGHKRIDVVECVKKVNELLQRQPDLFLGFQDFLPKGCDAKDSFTCIEKHNYNYKDALEFVHKIKNRFSDNDQNYYTSFLHILNMYRTYQKSILEVQQEVMMLFQDHDDLLKEFYCFMPNCSKGLTSSHALSRDLFGPTSTDYAGGEKMLQIERVSHDEYGSLNTHLHDLEDNERTKQFLSSDEISKCYGLRNTGVEHETNSNCSLLHTGEEGHLHKPVMEEDRLMEIKLNRYDQKEKLSWSVSPEGKCFDKDYTLSRNADVYEDNPIIDDEKCEPRRENFSNYQRYDSSYCFLPKNYPAPRASYMTELDASVLNDRLVSVPSGSENCTFKFMRRNKYEKCLFRCEDDRFDVDMMLLKVALTSQKVEDLLEQVHSNKIELGATFQIKDYLTDQDLRCIEHLYGDNGLEIVGHLSANASSLLPVISIRLKQKQEEGSRKRAELEKVWSEACAKYYLRSLDYRSYQFKQQDRRNLSSEALLDECRQVNEREEDNMLLKSVTGNRHNSSIMVFEYADGEIHDVLHKIMGYYCGERCNSKDEMDNIMRIWTTFLEPMFGVLTWLQDTESIKEKEQNSTSVPTSAHMDASLGAKDFATHLDYSHTSNASIFLAPFGKENVNNLKTWESVIHTGCGNQMDFYKNAHLSTEIRIISDYEDEREEGELSPEVHLGDGRFLDFEDSATEKTVVVKNSSELLINHIEAKDGTAMYDLNVNKNNKSTEMHRSDSSKAYHVVEDASVSEDYGANDAEESSCEHSGERKCVTQGFKSERMWVAEVSDADMYEAEGTSEQLSVSKPLAQHWPKRLHENRPSRIFYGNSSFYLLFRLHQILYDRILSSKMNASSTETRLRALKKAAPPNHFAKFKKALYSYLNGSTNKSNFEEDCFTFVGPQAYLLSTLDVLLSKLVKQLQEVASNKKENEFLQLFAYENSRISSRSTDLIYLQNVYAIHHGDIFRFECSSNPTKLSIQFMEHPYKESETTTVCEESKFAA